ncbi:hypothetical protein [Sphingomonas oleivorans]|uniref:hypothetical protein n=1 Tax=Sphingomonas oleivorans TaxID=1735121 RepID=UPI0013FD5294|nr:hypothetical protein [Sphingomonas oleivorans]
MHSAQDMLDFCSRHGIVAATEMVPARGGEEASDRMQRSDVKYQLVNDNASLAG